MSWIQEPSRRHQAGPTEEPNSCLVACFEVILLIICLIILISIDGPLF